MDLKEHPGLLFVAATLSPLASFLILFLAGGVRWALRPFGYFADYRPSPIGSYIATGGIGLAFVFSLIGFVLHYNDVQHHHHEVVAGHKEAAPKDDHKHEAAHGS